jgi:inosine-uridine nucleoside N-ribohydrolase
MKILNLLLVGLFLSTNLFAQKQKVWLDADTGNEMDDLYAIVRLLKAPDIEVLGLSSAHFNNADLLVFEKWNGYDTKGLKTVAESQRLNEQILRAMGLLNIPHPMGADRQIGRAWGGEERRDSPAAEAIIAAARSMSPGEKLHVLTLGALTNIASAVILAPDILPKVRCYALGARYDAKTKVWGKNEFNIRNDLNAFDYLLNLEGFDFVVMPAGTALPLQFDREDTYRRLDESDATEKILANRWREHFPTNNTWVMWDLALVEAYLRPDLAVLKKVKTPSENRRRKIEAYVDIDEAAMAADFWRVLKL